MAARDEGYGDRQVRTTHQNERRDLNWWVVPFRLRLEEGEVEGGHALYTISNQNV